jgi:hypothetical protein
MKKLKPYRQKLLKKKIAGSAPPREASMDPETGIMTYGPVQEDRSVLEIITHAFNEIGGMQAFTNWAQHNKDTFYGSIMPRAMPLQITGMDGRALKFEVIDPTKGVVHEHEGPRILEQPGQSARASAGKLASQAVPGSAVQGHDREERAEARGGNLAKESRKGQNGSGDSERGVREKAGRVLAHAADKRPGKKGGMG